MINDLTETVSCLNRAGIGKMSKFPEVLIDVIGDRVHASRYKIFLCMVFQMSPSQSKMQSKMHRAVCKNECEDMQPTNSTALNAHGRSFREALLKGVGL